MKTKKRLVLREGSRSWVQVGICPYCKREIKVYGESAEFDCDCGKKQLSEFNVQS